MADMKEIFSAAILLPPDQRSRFLDDQCAGDAALREAVEELIAAHDEAGTFMAGPTVLPAENSGHIDQSSPAEAQRIGVYRLVEPIGEGGFGTVYLAEQEHPVRRRVALKVIKL